MRGKIAERLTYTNVMASVAMFIAVAGAGAYAADKIGSRDIAKNAIKSKHVRANTLTGADVEESSLDLPAGPEGPQGPEGPAGEDGSPDTPEQIRQKLLTVDGAGSGIDADTVDGQHAGAFAPQAVEDWHVVGALGEPQFENDASSLATPTRPPVGFYRDPWGVVRLRGAIDQGTGNNAEVAFTLPAGYRPSHLADFLVMSVSNGTGRVLIGADGTVTSSSVLDGDTVLDAISFRCGPSGANGCP